MSICAICGEEIDDGEDLCQDCDDEVNENGWDDDED